VRATRLAALAFVVVIAAVMVALHEGGGDDDSVASPAVVVTRDEPSSRSSATPVVDAPTPGGVPIAPAPATFEERDAAAPGTPRSGDLVRGTLVDGSGRPIVDEPVRLELARDPWSPPPPDPRAPPETARGVCDHDGRFALPARRAALYTLVAGGRRWSIVRWRGVRAGDDLLVRLTDGAVYTGLVVDGGGAPVAGAHVSGSYDDETILARSADNGTFSIGPLPEGGVALGAWAPGFDVALRKELAVSAAPFTLELPEPRPVFGTVTDRESGEPVAGARVELVVGGGEHGGLGIPLQRYETTTDEAGGYLLDELMSIGFALHVEAEGYVPATVERQTVSFLGEDEPRDVRLVPHRLLEGRAILEVSGAPAVGASVRLEGPQGTVAEVTTDASGRYALPTDAWDGEGPLFVVGVDAEGRRARVALGRDATSGPELLLLSPAQVPVRVLAGGAPVAGARVRVLAPDTEPSFATTGADGLARVLHPRPDPSLRRVNVQARHEDLVSRVVPVELDALHGEPFELRLEDAGWIEGRVVDVVGAPVPSAHVRLRGGRAAVYADRDGRFRFGPVATDLSATLVVSAGGYRRAKQPAVAGGEEVTVVLPPEVVARGRVLDGSTSRALDEFLARLTVVPWGESEARKGPTARADPAEPGAFEVTLGEPGRYELRVLARDYARPEPLVFDFDGVSPPPFLEVVLSPAAVLHVRVHDTLGEPVPGVQLGVVPWEEAARLERPGRAWGRRGRGRSDADGLVRFELGDGGVFRVAAGATGWSGLGSIVVTPGPPVVRELRVPAAGALHVSVRGEGAGGAPVRVVLRSRRGSVEIPVRRAARLRGDTQGHHTFERLPAGEYEVWARARRLASPRVPVEVLAGLTANRRLDLEPVEAKAGDAGGRRGR